MSSFSELLAKRVQDPAYKAEFMKAVDKKMPMTQQDLERYEEFNKAVNEYLKEHPETLPILLEL